MNQALGQALAQAGKTIEGSLSSLFALNIVGSIFMTVSLKSMW